MMRQKIGMKRKMNQFSPEIRSQEFVEKIAITRADYFCNEIRNGDHKLANVSDELQDEWHNGTNGNPLLKELQKIAVANREMIKKGCGSNQFSRCCETHYEIDRLVSLNIPEKITVQKISEKLCQVPKNGNSPFNNVIGCNRQFEENEEGYERKPTLD